jgi:chromosome segregation protein
MQVDRLRLFGFKSFVEAAELDIRPGLTGIVGPNGCGKSNLAEALRWAMGENSARRLRGGEMDDVIFAGAAGRPPRDTAEVVVTLDNGARTAPRAFNDRDEIEIVRRIERGGGSVFRINGREVRARDVQVLFADAAAGGHFGSVIGQGQVAALIEAKPAERRQLLEEAAGTTGHQLRRREALGRLAAAEANLARLDDVLATLRAQLDTAARQGRRARRYRRLAEEIAHSERLLFQARRCRAVAEAASAGAARAAIEAAVATQAEAAAAARRRRDAAEAALPPLRRAETTTAAELARLTEMRAGLERELQRVVAARAEAERRRVELAADREREQGALADAEATLGRLGTERRRLVVAAPADRKREQAASRTAAAAERLAAAEAQLQQATSAETEGSVRRGALAWRGGALEAQHLRLERQRREQAAQRETLIRDLVPPETVQATAVAVAEAASRTADFAVAVEAAEDAASMQQSQEHGAFEAQQLAARRYHRLAAEAAALRAVLTPPAPAAARPIMAEIEVIPGFEAAVGALFDGELSAPLGPHGASGAFWAELPAVVTAEPHLPDDARPLAATVRAPAALGRRLAQSGWVEDGETGRRLQPRLLPGQCLVDRDGRLWRWDGFTRTEPARSAAAEQLEQQRRLLALAGEMGEAEAALRAADATLAAARAGRERAAVALRLVQADRRGAAAALDTARAAEATLARRALGAETRLLALDEGAARLAGELAEIAAAIDENARELAALPAASLLQEALAAAHAAAAVARREEADARAAVDRLAQMTATRHDRLAALDFEEQAWRKRADGAAVQLAALGNRLSALGREIAALADRPAALAAESEALGADIAAAAVVARDAAASLARSEAELREAAANLEHADGALAQTREERARLEVVRVGAEEALARLDRDIAERLGPAAARTLAEPAEADAAEVPGDVQEITARIERLRRERDAIGPVNLVAESEAAELDVRIDELAREHAELTAAVAKLRRGIAALDREARQRLLQAFERVGRHFAELFRRLFGGGEAELRLTEDGDALSAGLEIVASPTGKRLRNLSLLSGGEQALTALALIFGMFLTNPAPLCLLDEVDAPLDDANVERLCRLVAEIAETTGTRFLIVTHHRITMARADRLYGVTMSEPGVSRLVSVELAAAQRLRRTA